MKKLSVPFEPMYQFQFYPSTLSINWNRGAATVQPSDENYYFFLFFLFVAPVAQGAFTYDLV